MYSGRLEVLVGKRVGRGREDEGCGVLEWSPSSKRVGVCGHDVVFGGGLVVISSPFSLCRRVASKFGVVVGFVARVLLNLGP